MYITQWENPKYFQGDPRQWHKHIFFNGGSVTQKILDINNVHNIIMSTYRKSSPYNKNI